MNSEENTNNKGNQRIESCQSFADFRRRTRPENTFILKLIGTLLQIENHIILIKHIYPKEKLVFSPIIKNADNNNFHCFVDILPDILPSNNAPTDGSKTEES